MDDLNDEAEHDENDQDVVVENSENDECENEECENDEYENENSVESEEELDDIENIENLEEEADTVVDTFTEMKNMYRPNKADNGPLNKKDEKVEIKDELKDNVNSDESEGSYAAEEDIEVSEGSDNSEDIEDEEEEEEEISDVDDADLMKRLDSKYGKLPEPHSSDEEETEEKWTSNLLSRSHK